MRDSRNANLVLMALGVLLLGYALAGNYVALPGYLLRPRARGCFS